MATKKKNGRRPQNKKEVPEEPVRRWQTRHTLILGGVILGVIVLLAAMPVANNATLFSARYHKSLDLASKGVFISTMLSLFTIPLMVYLLLL